MSSKFFAPANELRFEFNASCSVVISAVACTTLDNASAWPVMPFCKSRMIRALSDSAVCHCCQRRSAVSSNFATALATEGYTPTSWKAWLKYTMRPDALAEELILRTREVTEAELREAWQRQYGEGGIKRTIRHLLVSSNYANSDEYKIDHYNAERDVIDQAAEQKAKDVLREMKAGVEFAELARQHSDDFSAENGGSLGKNWKSRIGLEFDRVVDGLSPGQVSDVFQTRRGYHIARVDGIDLVGRLTRHHSRLGDPERRFRHIDQMHVRLVVGLVVPRIDAQSLAADRIARAKEFGHLRIVDGPDPVALVDQRRHQRAADVAPTPGDQHRSLRA